MEKKSINGFALAAFILGILSLVVMNFMGVLAVIFGFVALNSKSISEQDRSFSKVGIITGIIATIIVVSILAGVYGFFHNDGGVSIPVFPE